MSERLAPVAVQLAGLVGRMLGWRPDEFWRTTPAELAAILTGDGASGVAPLSRREFDRLMEQEHD